MSIGFPSAPYLSGFEAAVIWNTIRATRAGSPRLTMSAVDRRMEYAAAIEQFEQLMRAAAAAGPATRPLPLFYAIEQAGRALLAAFEDDAVWLTRHEKENNLHGLTDEADPGDARLFSRRWLKFKKKGVFPRVLALFDGYPLPKSKIQLGALWTALPDLMSTRLPEAEWAPAIPATYSRNGVDEGLGLAIRVDGLDAPFPSFPSNGDVETRLHELLARHPDLTGWELASVGGGRWHGDSEKLIDFSATIGWRLDDEEWDDMSAPTLAREYRRRGARWLVPALNDDEDQLPPFLIWWALLYGLSIQARYHPTTWYEALAINVSPYAVPIEDLLNEALGAVPHLVLDRIYGEPFLL